MRQHDYAADRLCKSGGMVKSKRKKELNKFRLEKNAK